MSNSQNTAASSNDVATQADIPTTTLSQAHIEKAHLLIGKSKRPRRSLNVEKLPAPTCPREIASDVPDEMRKIIDRADENYNAISHLIGDEGRLGNQAFFLLSVLPQEQMMELGRRLECISDYDFQLVMNHFQDAFVDVNFAWLPHWGCSMFPNDLDRREQFLDEFTIPNIKDHPSHLADALTNFPTEVIRKHIDRFVGEDVPVQAPLHLVENTDLPEEDRAKLLLRSDYTKDDLDRAKKLLKDEDNKAALIFQNEDAANEG